MLTVARAELVREVKKSLDEPLTETAVHRSWIPTYTAAGLALGAAVILALVAWLMFW